MCRSPCPPELSRKELGVKSCSEEIQQGWWEVCIPEPKMQVQWERGRERRSGGSPAAVPLGSPPPRQCADDGTTGPWKKNQIRKPCYYIWRVRMTSWRKDTPITVARDILLQEHSCPAQTVAPRPGGSPSWAASRGCGALAAGGGAVAVHPAPGFSGHRAGSSPGPSGTPAELSPQPPVSSVLGCLSPHYKLPQT